MLRGSVLLLLALVGQSGALWVGGYYPGYFAAQYPISAVDFTSLTQLHVFAALPAAGGALNTSFWGMDVAGAVNAAHAAGVKALMTVGGEGTGSAFTSATSSMATFVANIVAAVNQWGFDGVDIDWEAPSSSSDYSAWLTLVAQLRAAKPGLMITAAIGAGNANIGLDNATFYAALANACDQVNQMTYGMSGNYPGWTSWYFAPIYGNDTMAKAGSLQQSTQLYLTAGVSAAKLGVGVGFYAQCWTPPVNGARQTIGSSSIGDTSYADVMSTYYSASNYVYDSATQSATLSFASATGPLGCTWVTYEDATSIAAKATFVRANGLGGTIIWDLAQGYRSAAADPNSILHAVKSAFISQSTGTTAAATTTAKPATTTTAKPATTTTAKPATTTTATPATTTTAKPATTTTAKPATTTTATTTTAKPATTTTAKPATTTTAKPATTTTAKPATTTTAKPATTTTAKPATTTTAKPATTTTAKLVTTTAKTTTQTTTRLTTSAPAATTSSSVSPVWVYHSGVFNWAYDWSWSATINKSDSSGAPQDGSVDVLVNITSQWGGFQPSSSSNVSLAGLSFLSFALKPATVPQVLSVYLARGGSVVGNNIVVTSLYNQTAEIAGAWTSYVIPFSALNITGAATIDTLAIQDQTSSWPASSYRLWRLEAIGFLASASQARL